MIRPHRASLALALLLVTRTAIAQVAPDASLAERAKLLAHRTIIIDTHVDVPYRLYRKWEDISRRTKSGDFDLERARTGGLDAPFMSIYVPSEREGRGAKQLADTLIDLVERVVTTWPDKFALARTPAAVESNFRKGLTSLPMGMENGSPIEGDLANVGYFHSRGIRYITLTHGRDNHISDSSYDTTHTWGGLSPFGRSVVREMNRVGIMVDISHVTDDAFYDVLEVTRAPLIASHSSCRAFTPGFERNMSDSMIVALAGGGGVIMINFGSSFLNGEYQQKEQVAWREVREHLRSRRLRFQDQEAQQYIAKYRKEHPMPHLTVAAVADHVDHVVRLVGIDHVGIGSDFDGVGDSLPEGLKDVSGYPNLIEELLKRGYAEGDIEKICSGNIMRVWNEVESIAAHSPKE
jgi:membrane dipeptidase